MPPADVSSAARSAGSSMTGSSMAGSSMTGAVKTAPPETLAPAAGPPDHAALLAILDTLIEDRGCAWSVGTFGALAEFAWVEGDRAVHRDPAARVVVTERGALRIHGLDRARPVAFEILTRDPQRWSQGCALCLPADHAGLAGRTALTELGPDRHAVLDRDKDALLFDMGLGAPHVDVAVRTRDPALIAVLRSGCGRSLLDQGSPAMAAIKEASPHRVFRSRVARIEVYQPIPSTARGIPTPEGPHTHVLPKLLAAGRTHSANLPIPDGLMPGLMIHPESPVSDHDGRRKAFDPGAFDAFQRLWRLWGPPTLQAEKERAMAAVRAGVEPARHAAPDSRAGRTALRVALRQLACLDGPSDRLAAWQAAFDPTQPGVPDDDHPACC